MRQTPTLWPSLQPMRKGCQQGIDAAIISMRRHTTIGALVLSVGGWLNGLGAAVFQDGDWVGREVAAAWYEVRRVEVVDVTLQFDPPPGTDAFVEFVEATDPLRQWRRLAAIPAPGGPVRDVGSPGGRFYRVRRDGGTGASPSGSLATSRILIAAQPITRVERTESVVLAPGFEEWHVRLDAAEPGVAGLTWRTLGVMEPGRGRLPFRFENLAPTTRFRLLARPAFDRGSQEVIVVGGQSNALLPPPTGSPGATGVWQGDARGQWVEAVGDPGDVAGAYRYGFATEAAVQLRPRVGRDFLLVPTAVGGSSLREWKPGENRYDALTLYGAANWLRLLWAPRGPRALWYFGHESSMQTDDALADYAVDWARHMAEWRRDAGDVPVIYAQVGRSTEPGISERLRLGAELQRGLESGQPAGLPHQHMVVSFDLPLADYIHLAAEGQRVLGQRFALAMRQHVYGEDVDGTGPRLIRVVQTTEAGVIRVEFNQPILAARQGYDGLFRVYAAGQELAVIEAMRGTVPHEVLLRVHDPGGRALEISYGDRPAGGFHQRLHDAVRNAAELPAPSFGRVPAAAYSSMATTR